MPTIQINLGYFVELGNLPFPLMMMRLFLDGGWIPILIVLLFGARELWLQSRRGKWIAKQTFCILAVDVPRQNEQTVKAVEQIFAQISGAYGSLDTYEKWWEGKFQMSISFEIVSVGGYVQFLIHTPTKYRDLVESSIFSHYPDADITEVVDYTDRLPRTYPHPDYDLTGAEFVLKKGSHLPIKTYTAFEDKSAENFFKDPLSGVLEVLSALRPGENLWIQIVLTPTDDSWKSAGEKEVAKMMGKEPKKHKGMSFGILDHILWLPIGVWQELASFVSFGEGGDHKEVKKEEYKMMNMSPGERQVLEQIQLKLTKIAFETTIRYVYGGRRDVFNKGRVTALKGAFSQYSSLDMNQFKGYSKVMPKEDYFHQRWEANGKKMRILANYRDRSSDGAPPFYLNVEELATLYHFPMVASKASSVKKTEAKRAEPPTSLPYETEGDEDVFTPFGPPPSAPSPGSSAPKKKGGVPDDLPFA
jgi:hypothetical protein